MPAILEPAIQGGFAAFGVLLGVGYQNLMANRQSVKNQTQTEINELVDSIQALLIPHARTTSYTATNPFWRAQAKVKGTLRLIATNNSSKLQGSREIAEAAEDCISEVSMLEALFKAGFPLIKQQQVLADSFEKLYLLVFPVSEKLKQKIEIALTELGKYAGPNKRRGISNP